MNKKIILLCLSILCIIPIGIIFFDNEKNLNNKMNNSPIIFHSYLTKTNELEFTVSKNFSKIPDTLIINPGKYIFEENVYELNSEGLYKFISPGEYNMQRIVYKNNTDALISSVAWIYSHGNSDNRLSIDEINNKAMSGKIFGTCGAISNWMKETLEKQNIPIRIVSTLTLEEWNSYDNGHTMVEIYRDEYNGWILYDLDNNAYFEKQNKPLSLIEFIEVVKKNENYEIVKIANDISLDISNFETKQGYNYGLLFDHVYGNEENLKEWYKRVIQVPMIKDNNEFYFFDNENKEKILEYSNSYSHINEQEFFKKFYSE
jgi:hypothetical protein